MKPSVRRHVAAAARYGFATGSFLPMKPDGRERRYRAAGLPATCRKRFCTGRIRFGYRRIVSLTRTRVAGCRFCSFAAETGYVSANQASPAFCMESSAYRIVIRFVIKKSAFCSGRYDEPGRTGRCTSPHSCPFIYLFIAIMRFTEAKKINSNSLFRGDPLPGRNR
jgi:hypothetical protein